MPNIIAFVLAQCQPKLRWQIGITTCTPFCILKNMFFLSRHAQILRHNIAVLISFASLVDDRKLAQLIDKLIQRLYVKLDCFLLKKYKTKY